MKYVGTYKDPFSSSDTTVTVRPATGDRTGYPYEYRYSHWDESHRWRQLKEDMIEYYLKCGTWTRVKVAQLPDKADIEDEE